MPYTRPWDVNTPLGSLDANQIDDAIRDKLLDIQERLNTIIGADSDMDQDPVIPTGYSLSELAAAATEEIPTVQRNLGWYAGHSIAEVGTISKTIDYVEITGTNGEYECFIPLVLPVGVVLTLARARVRYNDSDHTITGALVGYLDSNLNYNQALASPVASVSPQWIATGALNHTTEADNHYAIKISLKNNNLDTSTALRLFAVQVQFTHPGGQVR